jgi:hypothetical protein
VVEQAEAAASGWPSGEGGDQHTAVQVVRVRGVPRRGTKRLVAQNQDLDLLRTVRSGAQYDPAQELENIW